MSLTPLTTGRSESSGRRFASNRRTHVVRFSPNPAYERRRRHPVCDSGRLCVARASGPSTVRGPRHLYRWQLALYNAALSLNEHRNCAQGSWAVGPRPVAVEDRRSGCLDVLGSPVGHLSAPPASPLTPPLYDIPRHCPCCEYVRAVVAVAQLHFDVGAANATPLVA